jgi:hypothetical protein
VITSQSQREKTAREREIHNFLMSVILNHVPLLQLLYAVLVITLLNEWNAIKTFKTISRKSQPCETPIKIALSVRLYA